MSTLAFPAHSRKAALRAMFGAEYETYCRNSRRWNLRDTGRVHAAMETPIKIAFSALALTMFLSGCTAPTRSAQRYDHAMMMDKRDEMGTVLPAAGARVWCAMGSPGAAGSASMAAACVRWVTKQGAPMGGMAMPQGGAKSGMQGCPMMAKSEQSGMPCCCGTMRSTVPESRPLGDDRGYAEIPMPTAPVPEWRPRSTPSIMPIEMPGRLEGQPALRHAHSTTNIGSVGRTTRNVLRRARRSYACRVLEIYPQDLEEGHERQRFDERAQSRVDLRDFGYRDDDRGGQKKLSR